MLSFKDFPVGREFALGPRTISEEEIIAFAQQYDPQPFHLDCESEAAQQMGGLIASGWHTCSIFMRMMCDAYILDSASQGSAGLDEVRWVRPVRPGDTLSGSAKVTESRISKSRPVLGMLQFDYELRNQNNEIVMWIKGNGMMQVSEDDR